MKKKILVIEDEADLADAVVFRLTNAGYEALLASDGLEGYEKAKKEMPDLIILDLMLPKMSGYKVCELLKSDVKYKKIPIIILTARAQQIDKLMSEEVHANAYITKPFEPDALFSKIEELLSK